MEQMKVDPDQLITLDYENQDLPLSLRQFQPLVFKEAEKFCIVLGPDRQEGIFGSGDTLEEAMRDWDDHLAEEIDNPREGNETTRYVLDNLNTF